MPQKTFEETLRENEEDLGRIRSKFFPLIKTGTITGYNIYPSQFDYSGGEIFLSYLHPNLKQGSPTPRRALSPFKERGRTRKYSPSP